MTRTFIVGSRILQQHTRPGRKWMRSVVGHPLLLIVGIAAIRPVVAFIVDIRRQNLLQHLLYKAIIELSHDRAEFLSRLFSLPRPSGLGPQSTPQELIKRYAGVAPSDKLYQANRREVEE